MKKKKKKRIAVLGGGTGSLAAVWGLTGLPGAADDFEITVYQMGWRLGGKGASGRKRESGQRIEEHGLHVWGGFYENAFRVMRECYAELPPDPASPLKSWSDAFKKHSAVMLEEQVDGRWVQWPIEFPEDDEAPGTGGAVPTPWELFKLLLEGLRLQLESLEHPAAASSHTELRQAESLAEGLDPDPVNHLAEDHHGLLRRIEDAVRRFEETADRDLETDDTLRRLFTILDLGRATLGGLLRDGVLFHGFAALDGLEWRDWLRRHGARPQTLHSALVRGIYDYVFGFNKGRADAKQLEAGTATYGILRLIFTYKGALFWEMQAGMGDIVFAPLYLVLRQRGVRFRFFHRVEGLRLSAEGDAVERIDLVRQARPKGEEYEPLIAVKGVPSWPSTPLYEQLVDGDALAAAGVNLESAWAPRVGEPLTLERGKDFDDVVLGISLGAFRDVCPELIAANERFRDMAEKVQTVQTASTQLWLGPPAERLGAPSPPRIVSAFAQELNTWSDMSFLLPREDWPEPGAPRFLAYFCDEFPDAEEIPPYSDHGFPERERERYRTIATDWLEKNTGRIWSRATSSPDDPALDWSLLHDPEDRSGRDRLQAQYFRVNIDPTERYVLSLPGTSRYRLRAGESGFENVFLAGDWVRTSINAGCVEAAVMAGLDAAGALSGRPIPIVGGLE